MTSTTTRTTTTGVKVDLTHAADYISVTRNIFKDSYKTSLVGHSDSNEDEDTGHLRVTYFGNLFENCNSRLPSLRYVPATSRTRVSD
ncbi:hypothetical protein JCM10207_008557 [Rhodosporidiobolus poonsookiae]